MKIFYLEAPFTSICEFQADMSTMVQNTSTQAVPGRTLNTARNDMMSGGGNSAGQY
jgi:hypothetical protein